MKQVLSDTRRPVKLWTLDIEQEALKQVRNIAQLPFIHSHVAVMPDAHAGKGSTIGTVIATKGAIIPSAVGVDIGCGMCAVKLPFQADRIERLADLRHSIERSVPVGFRENGLVQDNAAHTMENLFASKGTDYFESKGLRPEKIARQLGTLGGGNHFIEVCIDTEGGAWVMLHSGSRNIGKCLAEVHINGAKDLMKKYFIDLPDPDLAYLVQNSVEFDNYISDLLWAQEYARANRNEMMKRVLKDISHHVYGSDVGESAMTEFRVDCHHNYTQMENHFGTNVWITRKGAVSAREGEFGIIPGSMGTKSYIVRGKGSADSFCSCSHGAGRRMSRTKAKATYTEQDFITQTQGVECRKDSDVLDEIPGAYKDIDEVMANQTDLVDVVYELKQIICIKG